MQLPNNNSVEKTDKEKPYDNAVIANDQFVTASHSNNAGAEAGNSQEPDFSEFMWMATEDLEDFDRKVISELDQHLGINSEGALAEGEHEFFQRMLDKDEPRETVYFYNQSDGKPDSSVRDLSSRMNRMGLADGLAAQSNLNPFAAEFIPGQTIQNASMAPELPITMKPQPNIHHMVAPVNPTSVRAVMDSSMQPTMAHDIQHQTLLWRQLNPQLSHRYNPPMHSEVSGPPGAVRTLYSNGPNGPIYMSHIPSYPMVNGGTHYVGVPHNGYQHPDCNWSNDDEGYQDN